MRGINSIRFYREKSGLTQAELAERANVSLKTVYRWEKNEREPRASDIKKLCEVLGCTESVLLNGPQKEEIEIKLVMSFEPMKGGISALNMDTGHDFTLCIGNGRLGIIGAAPLEEESDIDSFLAKAKEELLIGMKAQKDKRKLSAAE